MEITIRLMLIVVVSVIAILIALALIFNLGGDASSNITSIFDWIKNSLGSGIKK